MAAVVPWAVLEAVIEPHYPKVGPQGGRRPFPLAVMLRIYCLQQWYSLSDPGAEEALYDIQSMRAFCGLELGRDADPRRDDDLELPASARAARADEGGLRSRCGASRGASGALLRGGTIVDATLIAASPSTKNKERQARSRDALLEEGQPVVLRHEGAHRRRCARAGSCTRRA